MNKIQKENLIIILARKGTKNIARQNVRLVNGKPLIYYIIKKCQAIKSADVFVSTDSEEIRPDFMVLVYPVISMDSKITHQGSHDNLLGKKPTAALQLHVDCVNEQFIRFPYSI